MSFIGTCVLGFTFVRFVPYPLQDLLVYSLKGLASLAHVARTAGGIEDAEVNQFVHGAAFSTLTNVNL